MSFPTTLDDIGANETHVADEELPLRKSADFESMHPRDVIGRFTSGSGWRPSMSEENAKAWAADSKYPDRVWRFSKRENIESIAEHGFDLTHSGSRFSGNIFGPAIYFIQDSVDEDDVSFYAGNKYGTDPETGESVRTQTRERMDAYVKVDNPVRLSVNGNEDWPYVRSAVVLAADLSEEDVDTAAQRFALRYPDDFYPEAPFDGSASVTGRFITELLTAHGFDGIILNTTDRYVDRAGGDQVIVWDPERVVVVNDELRKEYDPNEPRDKDGRWTDGAPGALTGQRVALILRRAGVRRAEYMASGRVAGWGSWSRGVRVENEQDWDANAGRWSKRRAGDTAPPRRMGAWVNSETWRVRWSGGRSETDDERGETETALAAFREAGYDVTREQDEYGNESWVVRSAEMRKDDPTASDVHVDAPMGAAPPPPPRRKRKKRTTRRGSFVFTKARAKKPDDAVGPNEAAIYRVLRDAPKALGAPTDADIQTALSSRNAEVLILALDWEAFARKLHELVPLFVAEAETFGNQTMRLLPNRLHKAERSGFSLAFRHDSARVLRWARRHTAQLVTHITEEVRESIREVIATAYTDGIHPYDQVPLVRAALGEPALFPRWQNAVYRYLRKLLDDGRPDAENMAAAYRERLVDARSLMIARTETLSAQNAGREEAFQQAVDEGYLDEPAKRWLAAPEGPCPICEVLDGETVPWGQPFSNGISGPPAHPNCRCTVLLVEAAPAAG